MLLMAMHRLFLPLLAVVALAASAAQGSQSWKRAIPFSQASTEATKAARAVIHEAGSEECLRGKLSNAILQLSNRCDVSGRSSAVCELASQIAGQENELSLGEMLSTSEALIQMLGDSATSR